MMRPPRPCLTMSRATRCMVKKVPLALIRSMREFLFNAWWVGTFPGLSILALVLAINVASQGLRDAFDPRFQK